MRTKSNPSSPSLTLFWSCLLLVLKMFRDRSDLLGVKERPTLPNLCHSLPLPFLTVFDRMVEAGNMSFSFVPYTWSSFEEISSSLITSKWTLRRLFVAWKGIHIELLQSKMKDRGFVYLGRLSRWYFYKVNEGNRHWEPSEIGLQVFHSTHLGDCLAMSFSIFCTAPIGSVHHLFPLMYSAEVHIVVRIWKGIQYELTVIIRKIDCLHLLVLWLLGYISAPEYLNRMKGAAAQYCSVTDALSF